MLRVDPIEEDGITFTHDSVAGPHAPGTSAVAHARDDRVGYRRAHNLARNVA